MSILITWALEDSIETADSMRSRGYGQPGRTAFSLYVFQTKDRVALCWIVTITVAILALAASGSLKWYYFPAVRGAMTPLTVVAQVLHLLLCLTPTMLSGKGALLWNSLP